MARALAWHARGDRFESDILHKSKAPSKNSGLFLFMIFYTYILYSALIDKFYIGQTADLNLRLSQHNSTRNLGADDWIISYSETFYTRAEAMKREKEIKNKKSRKYIEWLIQQVG